MCDKTGNLECQLYNSLPHLLNLVILKLCKKVVDESPIGQCDRKQILRRIPTGHTKRRKVLVSLLKIFFQYFQFTAKTLIPHDHSLSCIED